MFVFDCSVMYIAMGCCCVSMFISMIVYRASSLQRNGHPDNRLFRAYKGMATPITDYEPTKEWHARAFNGDRHEAIVYLNLQWLGYSFGFLVEG